VEKIKDIVTDWLAGCQDCFISRFSPFTNWTGCRDKKKAKK